ncbi:MAG: hypothetical protein Q9227_003623 [Pyrenula ochraceoflavens]
MQCYTDLIPPSGVTDALSLPFTSATASNLIVARTSLLQIFSHKTVNNGNDTKLVLVAEYNLFGTITALGRVKILNPKSGGEAVLVALLDAKLSLIEWDPEKYSISTTSIHYYENEELQISPWAPDLNQCVSHLAVDPSSRCAAFNFGKKNLAILPFHQLGDDLVMDDLDAELDGVDVNVEAAAHHTNGDVASHQTPYSSSFVLSTTALDPGILHPVDITFLHEFREPAFGVLYSSIAGSQALLHERKDVVSYAVFTLDLEQRASTALSSTQRLPNDLFKTIPLPLPVGGSLLVGSNELVHVDQGGKTSAVGVNEFARQCSSFSMADQSDLEMRLEYCQIEQLGTPTGDMLIILSNGDLAILSFRLDGRTVSGLAVRRLSPEQSLVASEPSCAAPLGVGKAFIGFEGSDSLLIGWGKKISMMKRHSSRIAQAMTQDPDMTLDDDEIEEEDDDDIYGDTDEGPQLHRAQSFDPNSATSLEFRILDSLPSLASIKDFTFGQSPPLGEVKQESKYLPRSELEMVLATGLGKAGSVSMLKRELDPIIKATNHFPDITGAWSVKIQEKSEEGEEPSEEIYDQYVIIQTVKDGVLSTNLHSIAGSNLREKTGTDFDTEAGPTIDVGSLADGTRVVQVVKNEIRSYDSEFGLAQIYPIVDDDDSVGYVSSVSFAECSVLVVKDDYNVLLLQADQSGDLDEIDISALPEKEWLSGSLYADHTGLFHEKGVIMTLLGNDGGLYLFSLSDLSRPLFEYNSLGYLPTRLSDETLPRHWKEIEILTEAVVADLGDKTEKSPYLFIRTIRGETVLYQPFRVPITEPDAGPLRFSRIENLSLLNTSLEGGAEAEDGFAVQEASFKILQNLGGYSAIFTAGRSPCLILRTSSSLPQVVPFRAKKILFFGSHHTESNPDGFLYIDSNSHHLCRGMIPTSPATIPFYSWLLTKIPLHSEPTDIAYFPKTSTYALATSTLIPFHLPRDDEWHPDWADEHLPFPPLTPQSSIHLLSPKTHHIIDTYPLPSSSERVCALQNLSLSTSDDDTNNPSSRRDFLVVGTAIARGEDITARGAIYLFDLVRVVPDPDSANPSESDLKLKLIAKEDVKGAVTALSPIGSQGFFLASQGQKCMVRGLKEDNTILPVAFLDMNYHVSVAKELRGTGLCLFGDAVKGLWFAAYSEEPYKLRVLGKDTLRSMDVVAAEFWAEGFGKEGEGNEEGKGGLYIVALDGDGEMRIFQFDPENPKSGRGSRLLLRSSFHTGAQVATKAQIVPRTPDDESRESKVDDDDDTMQELDGNNNPPHQAHQQHQQQILISHTTGALSLLSPLPSEPAYRRLSSLQTILTTSSSHPCGLNPRAHRRVETDGMGGRGVLDGNLLQGWLAQSAQGRVSWADRAGAGAEGGGGVVGEIVEHLKGCGVGGGRGLGYL